MIEQISSVPLSSQISPSQEQEQKKPSQEEFEPSPSETVKVDTSKIEENQELELASSIVKETSFSEEIIVKNTSSEQQEETSVNNIKETENNNSISDDNITEIENNSSVTDDSIKVTEHNNSVTDDDNIKDPLNIEAAQLEISDIFNLNNNNNNNNTTNIENDTDCQISSPELTYVVDMDSLPSVSQEQNTSLRHLEYDVLQATGWDENYPPHQLLPKDKNSSKAGAIKLGKGWQSERHCTYPQEIILQVSDGVARIRKLQILSHHYKIATKIEIYVGSVQRRKEMVGKNTNTGSSLDEKDEKNEKKTLWDKLPKIIENDEEDESMEEKDYDIITNGDKPYILFRRLGYCALDSNERANYRARELKSVRLDTEGEYIRLVARRCYENEMNKFKQVGLVGITIMGEPADYLLAGESQKIPLPIENADEGLSRVASPETCIIPLIQDNNWMINSAPNDQRNFTSLYSILPNSSLSANNNTTTTSSPNNANDQTNKNKNPVTANDFLSNGEETANLLAAFGRAKQTAVKVEDFNLAKVLKYCIELIKQAAEEVGKFDMLKKQAVEEEDFDNAEKYKNDIEAIRESVRGALADEGLDIDDSGEVVVCDPSLQDIIGLADENENQQPNPNVTGVSSGNDHQLMQDHIYATSYIPKSRTNSSASMDRSGARAPEPMFPKSRTNSDASINRFLGGSYNNYMYEQQQEPSTTTYSTTPLSWTPFVDDRSIIDSSKAEPSCPPQDESIEEELKPLSDLARSAFALSIPFFGDEIIACILSKKLEWRESALSEVIKRINVDDENGEGLNVDGIDKLALVKATYQVMQEVLDDNREKMSLQVLTLWEKLIQFCVHHQITNSSTWKLVDHNYDLLFSKIADSNDEIKQSSTELFILLAKTYRTPTQSVLSLVLKPAKTSSQALKKAKPTIELIIRLVQEFGVVIIPKGKFDKDNKLSLDAVMEVSISYFNNENEEVRDAAVRLVVEVIKRLGKAKVGKYLMEVETSLLESILNLVKEWEEETGKVAGQATLLPPPKRKPKGVTEEINYEVDEKMLQKPLAARGTVSRIEQQLMEVRHMMNTTSHIIKDDYDNYLANATKAFHQDEIDEALAAEEALLAAELEAEEEQIRQAESNQKKSKTASATSKKTSSTSKSAAPSKAATAKKSKDDGKAAPSKKTSVSKSSAASSKGAAKPVSRRGSTDDVKSTQKAGRKNSINNITQNKLTDEPEKIVDEDESKCDRCCIFCDVRDDRFTEENLVTHYWNDCPVLTNCRLCNIILEISTLDDHMLNDCDKSKFVKQCPNCREVIEADDYLEHMAKQSCISIRQDIVRCPLCKTTVKPATEQGWKSHLLDESGCTKNRRKSRASAATSMVKEMEAAAEKREKKSTSATKSSATSKTTARKPTATSKDKPKKASTAKVSKVKK